MLRITHTKTLGERDKAKANAIIERDTWSGGAGAPTAWVTGGTATERRPHAGQKCAANGNFTPHCTHQLAAAPLSTWSLGQLLKKTESRVKSCLVLTTV